MVTISMNILSIHALIKRLDAASIEPAMVTARQPYSLIRRDPIGPWKKKSAKTCSTFGL